MGVLPSLRLIPLIGVLAAVVFGEPNADYLRLMNIGNAYLENRNAAKAVETFESVIKLSPRSPEAWRNLARAQLLARNAEAALVALDKARTVGPQSAATAYLTGLAFSRLSRFSDAVAAFEDAVRFDPDTPAVRFQLANAYQATEKHKQAKAQLQDTIRLDPLHASAYFKLAGYARKDRDRKGFQKFHREFMRLRQIFGDAARSAVALELCIHTKPEPWALDGKRPTSQPLPTAIDISFVDVTTTWLPADGLTAVAADVIEVDDRGRCILMTIDSGGALTRVAIDSKATTKITAVKNDPVTGKVITQCLVGDFLNDMPTGKKFDPKTDAYEDLLLLGQDGIHLLQSAQGDEFRNVTETSGLQGVGAKRVRWADYDHDGDLDLLLARDNGFELWQNAGNGRFENVTAAVGIEETGAVRDVMAIDLDADLAIDIVLARGDQPTIVYRNLRAGRFGKMPEPPGPWPPAELLAANDLDNNGYPDVVLVDDSGAIIVYGKVPRRGHIDFDGIVATAVATIDYDNDGWLDLIAVGHDRKNTDRGRIRLWRNIGKAAFAVGKKGWVDVTDAIGLGAVETPALTGIIGGDLDGDGDTDLALLASDRRLRLLLNDGGHVNGQLKLRLTTIKTNPSAIGTHVEARAGSFWMTRSVMSKSIELGLGGRKKLDTVQTIWTNGVVDNRIDVMTKLNTPPLDLLEKNVATGSCPYLYAWDGSGFRFVTDLLGNSPLGLSIKRDVVLPADPDEIVFIGYESDLVPRDGRYLLEITEETRELLYLDDVKLIVVDHPPGWEVHPTDKLMPPPFPESAIWALSSASRLHRAIGDDGIDRTKALQSLDGVFAEPGVRLPSPYRGMCAPLALTMDFGPLDENQPYVLSLTGWLQYGDASTNIAMSQNESLTIIPPTLELETGPDSWTTVEAVVGMPAGKTKTILVDLAGKLPKGAHRLRLTTTFEIRWDRIALLTRNPDHGVRQYEFHPTAANLYYRGFSEIKSRASGCPTTPVYDRVSATPLWRTTPQGWCTRFGDVLELVNQRDERLAILNAGDALTLTYDATALPPKPTGMARSFFLYTVGWDKDGDYNVVDGDTVEPLPIISSGERLIDENSPQDWRLRYNTRWVPRDQFAPAP